MKLGVPYYSQRMDVLDENWKHRSCGICALAMAMEFLAEEKFDLDELIKEGLEINAYLKNVGWVHQGLVDLAKKHGFKNSFRREWPEGEKSEAAKRLAEFLEKGIPVLASVKNKTNGHLVLLVGFEKGGETLRGFYAHDPDAQNREAGAFKFLGLPQFLQIWKSRVIIVQQ